MKATKMSLMLAMAAVSSLPMAWGQQAPATIQGHANNEIGSPIANGEIRVTPDGSDPTKTKALYTFKTDANGDFKGADIAPGKYEVSIFAQPPSGGTAVLLDYLNGQEFKTGQSVTENFDLSRADYIAKLSPERRSRSRMNRCCGCCWAIRFPPRRTRPRQMTARTRPTPPRMTR